MRASERLIRESRSWLNGRSEFIVEEATILKLEPLSLLHLAGNRK